MIWVDYFHVKETNYFAEADVIVPRHVEETIVGKDVTDQQREEEQIKEDKAGAIAENVAKDEGHRM